MEQKPVEEITLPLNYKILCNVNKYIVKMPGGTKIYKWNFDYTPYNTYQDAVDRAWEQYRYNSPPPDTVEYYDCDINIEERIEVQ